MIKTKKSSLLYYAMILTNKIYKPVIRMQFIAMQLVWVKFKRTP